MQTHKYENMKVEFCEGLQATRQRGAAAASAQGGGRPRRTTSHGSTLCSGPSRGCLFCSDSDPRIVSQLSMLHTRHMAQSGHLIDSSWLMGPADE